MAAFLLVVACICVDVNSLDWFIFGTCLAAENLANCIEYSQLLLNVHLILMKPFEA